MDREKLKILNDIEAELSSRFQKIDEIALSNTLKVLSAFQKEEITNQHFAGTTGYGYTDKGKEGLSKVYSDIFETEDAVVTSHLTSGTHAIATCLYGLLRPKDTLLSISGDLYDTLSDTLFGKDNGSLENYGITAKFVELKDGKFDEEKIFKLVKKLKPKVVFVQRSRGYSARKALSVFAMEKIFQKIKEISPKSFIVVDNCYGEFMETKEPTAVGADVAVGSLIKNIGGGLAPTGGYIAGTKRALALIENRLTCPSLGRETGSYESGYRLFYQGLFIAPHVVKEAVKGAYLIGEVMKKQGYKIIPDTTEDSFDIIKSIVFDSEEELVRFVHPMAGYTTNVIMAAGTFVEGASIELSCDSPIKKPYIAYFQGGLTYEHLKLVAYSLLDFKK